MFSYVQLSYWTIDKTFTIIANVCRFLIEDFQLAINKILLWVNYPIGYIFHIWYDSFFNGNILFSFFCCFFFLQNKCYKLCENCKFLWHRLENFSIYLLFFLICAFILFASSQSNEMQIKWHAYFTNIFREST